MGRRQLPGSRRRGAAWEWDADSCLGAGGRGLPGNGRQGAHLTEARGALPKPAALLPELLFTTSVLAITHAAALRRQTPP